MEHLKQYDLPIRGPAALIIVYPGDGWPLSNLNLNREGCEHDAFIGDLDRLNAGHAIPCAKCGATMIDARAARILCGLGNG